MNSYAVRDWRSSANSIPSGRVWKVSEVISSVAWTLSSCHGDSNQHCRKRVYTSKDDIIRVHLNQVTRCPLNFPFGYFWYGDRRNGPGRPPKVVEQEVGEELPEDRKNDSGDVDDTDPDSDEQEQEDDKPELLPPSRTCTRVIRPPLYYGRK